MNKRDTIISTTIAPAVPLMTPRDTPDVDGLAYLAMAHDELAGAIHWFVLALHGRPDWQEALGIELDQLRNVLAAIEQEQRP